MGDFLYAIRSARKRPLASLTIILILGVGIGATTAVFSVVDGLLLEPLPYPEPDRLVRVWKNDITRGYPHTPLIYPEYVHWIEASESFESAALMWTSGAGTATLVLDAAPREVRSLAVTSNFFDVLGVPAFVGRTFEASDDDGGETPALILSHRLWSSAFGADRGIVGQTIRQIVRSHETFRVVGVLPRGLDYPADVDTYIVGIAVDPDWRDNRHFEADIIGRLAPKVDLADTRSELTAIAARLSREYPEQYREMPVVVTPLLDTIVGDVGHALWFLLGTVALVLAIASANVASLLLVRGAEREREIAIRVALGAGRGRLIRQLVAETLVLAGAGGIVGGVMAHWSVRILLLLQPIAVPRAEEITFDPGVLAFACLATLTTALAAGLFPAWRTSRRDALGSLRRGRGVLTDWRAMSVLVVGELTLAFVLVVGAGLLIKTLAAQLEIERGFDTEDLVIASVQIPGNKYSGQARIDLADRLVERIQAIPSVTAATPVFVRPGRSNAGVTGALPVEGQTEEEAKLNPMGNIEIVYENYFQTMGIPILQGRLFTRSDRGNDARVAIVSRSFAEYYWPDDDPIGRRIGGRNTPLLTVVGVTRDVRYRERARQWLDIYLPAGQNSFGEDDIPGFFHPDEWILRTRLEPEALAPMLREIVLELDADIPVERVTSLDAVFASDVARPRFHAVMLALFATIALVLAAVGIYGVIATLTYARAAEIGIRLALGATPGQAVGIIWKRGAALAMLGVGCGIAAAIATTRTLQSFLYEVSPVDPGSFLLASVVLMAAALTAAYLPARRAARVDPAVTLRHE